MSYQSYLNNRELQQSLQGMFGDVQTEADQSMAEANESANDIMTALKGEKTGEEETGAESSALGLAELSGTEFLSGIKTQVKGMFSDAVSSLKKTITDGVNDQVNSLKSAAEDQINAIKSSGTKMVSEKASSVRGQFNEAQDSVRGNFEDLRNTTNITGDSSFSRLLNSDTTTVRATSGRDFMSGLLDDGEFEEALVNTINPKTLRSGAGLYEPANAQLPSVSDLDELTMRGMAYNPATTELPSVTRAGGATTETAMATPAKATASVEADAPLEATSQTVLKTTGEAGAEMAGADVAETAGLETAGLAIPGLDVIAGIAGIAYGLYDLFKGRDASVSAPPPPPQVSGISQQVATVQAGI